MQIAGATATRAFGAARDINEWAGRTPLSPTRIPSGYAAMDKVDEARERLSRFTPAALARLTELAG